jgi:hypothetical protein
MRVAFERRDRPCPHARAVHAAGVELDHAFRIRQAAQADREVLGIGFHKPDTVDSRLYRRDSGVHSLDSQTGRLEIAFRRHSHGRAWCWVRIAAPGALKCEGSGRAGHRELAPGRFHRERSVLRWPFLCHAVMVGLALGLCQAADPSGMSIAWKSSWTVAANGDGRVRRTQ